MAPPPETPKHRIGRLNNMGFDTQEPAFQDYAGHRQQSEVERARRLSAEEGGVFLPSGGLEDPFVGNRGSRPAFTAQLLVSQPVSGSAPRGNLSIATIREIADRSLREKEQEAAAKRNGSTFPSHTFSQQLSEIDQAMTTTGSSLSSSSGSVARGSVRSGHDARQLSASQGTGLDTRRSSASQGTGLDTRRSSASQGTGLDTRRSSASQGTGLDTRRSSASQRTGLDFRQMPASQGTGQDSRRSSTSQRTVTPRQSSNMQPPTNPAMVYNALVDIMSGERETREGRYSSVNNPSHKHGRTASQTPIFNNQARFDKAPRVPNSLQQFRPGAPHEPFPIQGMPKAPMVDYQSHAHPKVPPHHGLYDQDPMATEFWEKGMPSIEAIKNYSPFELRTSSTAPSTAGVLKIESLPYAADAREIAGKLNGPYRIKRHTEMTPFESIFIILDRDTGKSMDAFIEFETERDAAIAFKDLNSRRIIIGPRVAAIVQSSQSELMQRVFSKTKCVNWQGQNPVITPATHPMTPFNGFLTKEELFNLTKYAEAPHKAQFVGRHPERPYQSMIQIMVKYPWWRTELYTLGERDMIAKTTMQLISTLTNILQKGDPITPKSLEGKLLEELLCVALHCPGFSEEQRNDLMVASAGIVGEPKYVSPLAQTWPFTTLQSRIDISERMQLYYAQLLKVTTLSQATAKAAKGNEQFGKFARDHADNPFGNMVEFTYRDAKATFEQAAQLELDALKTILKEGQQADLQQYHKVEDYLRAHKGLITYHAQHPSGSRANYQPPVSQFVYQGPAPQPVYQPGTPAMAMRTPVERPPFPSVFFAPPSGPANAFPSQPYTQDVRAHVDQGYGYASPAFAHGPPSQPKTQDARMHVNDPEATPRPSDVFYRGPTPQQFPPPAVPSRLSFTAPEFTPSPVLSQLNYVAHEDPDAAPRAFPAQPFDGQRVLGVGYYQPTPVVPPAEPYGSEYYESPAFVPAQPAPPFFGHHPTNAAIYGQNRGQSRDHPAFWPNY